MKPLYERWWGALLICASALFLWFVVAQVVPVVFVFIYMLLNEGLPSDLLDGISLYLPFITAFSPLASLAILGVFRVAKQLPPPPRIPAMRPLPCALFALVGGAVTLGGGQAIAWALHYLGFPVSEQDVVEVAFKVLGRWTLLGGIGLLAPIGEELLFRRIGFAALLRGTNRPIAYGLTMLAFALIHGNPSAFVIYLWIGFVVAFAYDRTGRVEVSIAIHAINNIVAVLTAT